MQIAKTAAAAAAQIRRTKLQRREDAETEKIKKANGEKARTQQQAKAEEERRTQKKKEERIKQLQDTMKRNKSKNKESGKLKTSTKRARWHKLGGVKRYLEINCKEEAKRKPCFFLDLQKGSRRKTGKKRAR